MEYVKNVYTYKSPRDYNLFIEKILYEFISLNPDNIVSSKTKISRHKGSNLGDISVENGIDLLITYADPFDGVFYDPYSKGEARTYFIYLTRKKTDTNQELIHQDIQTITNGLTKNLNNTSGSITAFEHTINISNKTYQTNLNANEVLSVVISPEGENPNQPNYITAVIEIKFQITQK